jgi:hypothetical protein
VVHELLDIALSRHADSVCPSHTTQVAVAHAPHAPHPRCLRPHQGEDSPYPSIDRNSGRSFACSRFTYNAPWTGRIPTANGTTQQNVQVASHAFRVEDTLRGGEHRAHFLELGVTRTFEFASALRRMSADAKCLKSASMQVHVWTSACASCVCPLARGFEGGG